MIQLYRQLLCCIAMFCSISSFLATGMIVKDWISMLFFFQSQQLGMAVKCCFLYSYSGMYSNAFPWKRVEMSAWVTGAQTHNICTCLLRSAHILVCICSLPFSLYLSFLFFHVQFIAIYILYAYKLILNINIKQNLSWTIFNIHNVSWAANHHIRMISEGSYDTQQLPCLN